MKIYADFYADFPGVTLKIRCLGMVCAEFTLKRMRAARLATLPRVFCGSIFQPAVVTPKRVLHLPSQHHLCVLQGLVVEQPVQLRSLCRGVAVLVLHGNAVDDNGGAMLASGFCIVL